jgi:hypothetical protein
VTKTVDGMCADCWGVKDPARAKRWLRGPRTRPLFSDPLFELDDPLDVLWLIGAVVAALLVVAFVAGKWI